MRTRWQIGYLAFALIITSVMCFVTAPFFAPDETAQSLRAIALSHGHLLPQMLEDQAGDPIDTGVTSAIDASDRVRSSWERRYPDFKNRGYGAMTLEAQQQLAKVRWSGKQAPVGFGNTAIYPPLFYVPGAVGWRVAEALDLTVVNSLRLARLLTSWSAVCLAFWALYRAGRDGWLLLPLLLLPSALFVEASSSQDALLLTASAALVAVTLRPLREMRVLRSSELTIATLLAAACAMARPPYLTLALLLLVPFIEAVRTRTRARHWFPVIFATMTCTALCFGWHLAVARFGMDTADEASPASQVAFLSHHPLRAVAAVARGTAESAFDLVHRGLYVIGWNDLIPHHGASAILFCSLVLFAYCLPPLPCRRRLTGCLVLAAVLLAMYGISLAEYLIWTPPGLSTVYGIQPRYWLPVTPALGMLVAVSPRPALTYPTVQRRGLIVATVTLVLGACTLPWFAAEAFYRLPLSSVIRLNLSNRQDSPTLR